MCGQGYNTKLLQAVTGDRSSCPKGTNGKVFDLNYPSFALSTPFSNSISHVFNRTVTNVGTLTSTYKAKVSAPPGLSIKVNPSVLSFTCLKQKLSFTLTIEGTIDRQIVSASLIWDDGTFQVRSPIVVYIFWNSIYGTCITNIKHAKALVSKIKLIIKQKLWSNMLIKKDDWGDEITPQKMVVNLCCFIVINYSAPIKDCVFDM